MLWPLIYFWDLHSPILTLFCMHKYIHSDKYGNMHSKLSKSWVWNYGHFSPSSWLCSRRGRTINVFSKLWKCWPRKENMWLWLMAQAWKENVYFLLFKLAQQTVDILASDNCGHMLLTSFLESAQWLCLVWDINTLSKITMPVNILCT